MATKFTTETVEVDRKINFLINVDPTFVSLVRHGANRTPFRVIKTEEGTNEMMFVQSILVPEGIDLSQTASKDGLQWLADAKLDKVEKQDGYVKYTQMAESKFDKNLAMVKLDEAGVYAVTGSLVNKDDASSALTFEAKTTSKMMEMPQSVANAPVATVERQPSVISFKEMFEVELDNFLSVVRGTLSQTGLESAKRKKTVMQALDGFKNFLNVALDTATSATKGESGSFTELNDKLELVHRAIAQKENGDMTKDEVKSIIIDVLNERDKLTASKAEADAKKAEAEAAAKKTEDTITSLSDSVKVLGEKVDGLVQKQEDMGNRIIGSASSGTPGGDTGAQGGTAKPKSVFSGLLTGKKAA